MKQIANVYILLVLLLAAMSLPAKSDPGNFAPVFRPKLTASKAVGSIRIDGQIDDAGWTSSARATNFVEHYPGDQTKPAVATEVLITYDESSLYVAFICYDDPKSIRSSISERDNIANDDYVQLCLDTYGDAAWAYVLYVNPYGIQGDAMWANAGGEDDSYDLIWESAGIVTDTGYQVELAVPFSSLRFSHDNDQVWRVDFGRKHPREVQAEYSWAAYSRDENCWPCQWGTVDGISGVRPGRGLEFTPALVAYQSGGLSETPDGTGSGEFVNHNPDGDLSLWARYGLSSEATVEMTVNPDFSQIEADAGQIDVNTTFALAYPERRPFFQEGSDIFRTPIRTFYTRAINDPEYAAKATLRSGRTSLGYLAARDKESYVYLPSEEQSFGVAAGASTSNVLRLRQAVAGGSQVGLVVTDQRFGSGWSNSTITHDGRFRLTPSVRAQYQIGLSHVREPNDAELSTEIPDSDLLWNDQFTRSLDGESFWGTQSLASIVWWTRGWNASLTYLDASPTFHHYLALIRQNHYRNLGSVIGYFHRPESGLFETINPHVRAESEWNWTGTNKYITYELCLWTRLRKAQASFYSQYVGKSESFGGVDYDNTWYWYQDATMSLGDPIRLFVAVTYGHQIARRHNALGKILDLNVSLDIKPHDRLLLQQWLDHARAIRVDDAEELYDGYIYRTRLNYQVSRPLSARLVIEYDDFYKTWRADPLITYRLNPFSVLYVGMTSTYARLGSVAPDGVLSYGNRLSSRQVFLKLQYLFQV